MKRASAARGRAAAGVVTVVAVGALLASGCEHGRYGVSAGSGAGAVPWTDHRAPRYVVPPPVPKAHSADYPACASAGLTGQVGSFSVGAGNYSQYLDLTNSGSQPCTLQGGPASVTAAPAYGTQVTLATSVSTDEMLMSPANLQPGQSAQLAISTSDMCPATPGIAGRYDAVTVALPGGGSVTVSFPASDPLVIGCGAWVSQFGTLAQLPALPSSPLNVLTITTSMPRTVTAGATAAFRITLRNPAGHAVRLRPCPEYGEFIAPLGIDPLRVTGWYYLNCRAASTIPAHGSVTFDMRIHVPARAHGFAKYGWSLAGTTLKIGGLITITPGRDG
jgi:hypothetical protein